MRFQLHEHHCASCELHNETPAQCSENTPRYILKTQESALEKKKEKEKKKKSSLSLQTDPHKYVQLCVPAQFLRGVVDAFAADKYKPFLWCWLMLPNSCITSPLLVPNVDNQAHSAQFFFVFLKIE